MTAPALTPPRQTLELVFEFHRLVPDNRRVTRTPRGKILLTTRYRQAKHALHDLASTQMRGPPLLGPLALTAKVFFPDLRRRDAANLRKILTDALIGVCYVDDVQLWRETWERSGVDRVRPRVEVTLTAWTSSS